MKFMRNLLCVLLVALMLVMPFASVNAKTETAKKDEKVAETVKEEKESDPVKIYVFYGEGCPHCEELHNYLDTLATNKDVKGKYEVVDYEVWYNDSNSNFLTKVGDYFKTEIQGVPFYVIGEKYYSGFGEDSKTTIVADILANYGNEDYKDVVSKLGKGVSDSDNEDSSKKSKKTNNIIGISILGAVLAFIVVMILMGNRSNDDDVVADDEKIKVESKKEEKAEAKEEIKEEKVELKEETKKAPVKKTAAKKASTKKTTTKASAAKKTPAKKTVAKKEVAKKVSAKKTATKKTTAKKSK